MRKMTPERQASRDRVNAYIKSMSDKLDAMCERDQTAKREGKLEGRYIQEQIADGYAYYLVVALTDMQMVKVEHVVVGDAWQVPMIEDMDCLIPLKYVKANIGRRDSWSEMLDS